MAERYRDKLQSNPKYRLPDDVADFLSKAKSYGIDKLTAVMEEEEELPFFLNIEDGENEVAPPLDIDHKKTLILGDVHLGFHDRQAVETAINYGRKNKVDAILLNGDILDFYALSRFDKTPNKGAIVNEIKLCREFFRILREVFPQATIYYKKGNHEERYDKYFAANAKELYGFDDFLLEKIIHCDKYGIIPVSDRQLITIGELGVYHGHEIGGGGEHVAARLVQRTGRNILFNHYHKTQSFTLPRLNKLPVAGFAVACLCKLNPYYMPVNKWNNGMALVELFHDKTFHVHNKRIINGQAV